MSDKAQSCPKCGAPNPNAAPVQQFSYQPQMMFNPCARHPQAPAVAHCGQCGAALCADCKDITAYEYDNKPLCIDCNIKVMEAQGGLSVAGGCRCLTKELDMIAC